MRKFLLKLVFLIIIPSILISLIILRLPTSNRFNKCLLWAIYDKQILLKETKNPRIIFIGGSNISFGLNSKLIKDSLNINPINTGLTAQLGLKFMLSDIERYVKRNDIIVLTPEYQQFYSDYANGDIELLSLLVNISPELIILLDFKQFIKLSKYLPELMNSKLNDFIYNDTTNTDKQTIGIYDRKSFNSFGDAYIHWSLPKEKYSTYAIEGDVFNNDALDRLNNFRNVIEKKGAKLFICFPGLEASSFDKSLIKIEEVENRFKKLRFCLLSSPERYKMPDSLMYNSIYHLTKEGVDFKTQLLIQDLKRNIKSTLPNIGYEQ